MKLKAFNKKKDYKKLQRRNRSKAAYIMSVLSFCVLTIVIVYILSNSFAFKSKISYALIDTTTYIEAPTLYNVLLGNNTLLTTKPSFTEVSSNTDTGLYEGTGDLADEYGVTYYFRGTKELLNNNVLFAGFQWKIIRTNGDGSIRMIYNGTEAQYNSNKTVNSLESSTCQASSNPATGCLTSIGVSAFNPARTYNSYVGYMYGNTLATNYVAAHANTTNSTAKNIIDSWYSTNIAAKGIEVTSKIANNIFCNDRTITSPSGVPDSNYTNEGYSNKYTVYAANTRLFISNPPSPTLKCTNTNDQFTLGTSSNGNKKLAYPVGLITADEMMLAGTTWSPGSTTFYLYTAQEYWTMTPFRFYGTAANVWRIYAAGGVSSNSVDIVYGIRPVINLSASVTTSFGDGSATNPYRIN